MWSVVSPSSLIMNVGPSRPLRASDCFTDYVRLFF
jgi:hypothetical protein